MNKYISIYDQLCEPPHFQGQEAHAIKYRCDGELSKLLMALELCAACEAVPETSQATSIRYI
jgi:hypothetical protein